MSDHMIVGPAPGQAADTVAAIDAVRPDLVVASFFGVGAMIGAESRGVLFDVPIPNVYFAARAGHAAARGRDVARARAVRTTT